MFRSIIADESGATAIEYSLIAGIISIAAVLAFAALGLNLADIFTSISDTLAAALA